MVRSTTVPIADRLALPVIRSPLPVAGDAAIGDVGRAPVDHHHRRNEAAEAFARPATSLAVDAPAFRAQPPRRRVLRRYGPRVSDRDELQLLLRTRQRVSGRSTLRRRA